MVSTPLNSPSGWSSPCRPPRAWSILRNCIDALSWGSFTWFNALGVMAPLAGLPFLLLDGALLLSFMSWVGHMLFGCVAVVVFERLEARA